MSFKDFPLKNLIFRQSNARTLRTRSLALLSLLLITTISVQAQSPITFQNTLSSFYEYGVSIFYGASRATSSAKSEAAATQQTSERCAGNMTAPFSVEADFSLESNPCGVFSYGFIAANDVNSTFALYPPAAADTQIGSLKRGSRDDANDLLDLRPVSSGERAVVRFTMPANNKGAFAVNGRFVGLGSGEAAMNAAIVRRTNGIDTTLFAAELKGANDAKEFDFAIADLAEGDIIDFIVDGGGDGNNSVGLAANIGRQAVVAPEIVFAIANTTPQSLVQFDASTPNTVTTIDDITGLGQNETLVGIDFRPRNRVLYGVSLDNTSTGRLYRINTTTAAATLVSTINDAGTPIAFDGTEYGVDFNPVPDRLRIISSNGQNLRVNPDNGATTVDDALNPVDAGGTSRTGVTGAAYTNNDNDPATNTTLYDIDTTNDTLVVQNPPDDGTLTPVGTGLGFNVNAINGFDISGTTGVAYGAFLTGASSAADLYEINLTSGAATRVGRIDTSLTISGMSATPIGGVNTDSTMPTVTITQAATQPDPTNVSPINFTVVFSEDVTGSFDGSDVTLGGSAGATTAVVTGSGTTYNVAVSGMTNSGTVTASIPAGAAQDLAGNNNTASIPGDNTVTYFLGSINLVVDDDGFGSAFDCNDSTPTFNTVQSAVAAASAGNTIRICPGNYPFASTVNITQMSLTVIGAGPTKPVLQISQSTGFAFTVNAPNVTLDNLEVVKSDDTAGPHNLIYVNANNFTAQNNLIRGPDWRTLDAVTRAFEITSGLTGLLITNNTIQSLRQPAYINGSGVGAAVTGTISNNTVTGTKGFVVAGASVNFTGNVFGQTCPTCGADIALLSNVDPAFYNNLLALSTNNDNAFISVQFTPAADDGRAVTFVDDSAAANGDGRAANPRQTIQDGINNTLLGGTVNVAAGTYPELVNVNRTLTINGARTAVDARDASRTGLPDTESVVTGRIISGTSRSSAFNVSVINVKIDGFTVQDNTNQNQFGTGILVRKAITGTQLLNNIVQNNIIGIIPATDTTIRGNLIRNNNQPGSASGTGIYAEAAANGNPFNNVTIDNNTISGNNNAGILLPQTGGTTSNIAITGNRITGNGSALVLFGLTSTTITGNTITNSSGSQVFIGGNSSGLNINCNTIASSPSRGVNISGTGNSNILVNNNNFVSNTIAGVRVADGSYTGNLDATSNYWGAPDGPGPVGPGSGDKVSANVDFTPFFNAPVIGCAGLPAPPPTVTINQATTQEDPTDEPSIEFDVVFSEAVTGFTTGDVTVSGTAGATTATVTQITPSTYTVSVTGMTNDGTVIVSIAAGVATGASGANVASTSNDNTVTYDATDPTATLTYSGVNPTNSTLNFSVAFSEVVSGLLESEISVTNGTVVPGSLACSGSPTTCTFSVTASSDGAVTVQVPANAAQDAAGNGNTASNSISVTFDGTVPTVTIEGVSDPDTSSPVDFTVTFSEDVTGFTASDVVVTGSAFTTGTPVVVITGGQTVYNVAVSGMNQTGNVAITIAANMVIDTSGNGNTASTAGTPNGNDVQFNLLNTPVTVNPTNTLTPGITMWGGFDDVTNQPMLPSYVEGPALPNPLALGTGSASLNTTATGKYLFASTFYNGTLLNQFTELSYSSFANDPSNSQNLPSLQIGIDYDSTDANTGFQGRLVFDPSNNQTSPNQPPAQNTWQRYNATNGRYFFTQGPGTTACGISSPCSLATILATYPRINIPNTAFGFIGFRSTGGGTNAVENYVDAFTVGVASANTTFNFEAQPPTVSINDAPAVTEGNAGTTTATFTVSISPASQLDTTVTVATVDGTATVANNDFTALPANQTVTIPAGQTSMTFNVTVNGDTNVEGNETFNVNLSNALNAAIADGQGVGTINNDDVFVSFSSATYGVGEAAGTATITVTRNGVTPNAVTVNYATGNGSGDGGAACTAGIDFINTNGTLSFASNETSKTFTVTICNDLLSENPETVNLTLSGVTGGATLGTAAATLTITDNDGGGPVSISGVITQDSPTGAGLNGVTVTLTGTNVPANTTTTTMTINGVDGSYSFTGLTGNATSPNNYLVTPSLAGRVFDPTERSYVNLGMNVTNANFAAFNTGAVPRNLRVVTTSQSTINSTVTVPIVLDSLGTENALSFSLNYNPAFLSNPTVVCGSDAPGCQVSSNNVGGTLGIVFTRDDDVNNNPTAFTAGTGRQVVRVTFTATPVTTPVPSPSATYSTPITFGDSPTARDVNDVEGNSVPTNYVNGSVIFAQGIEGDVAPRFNGDGNLSGNDVTVLRQFVNGSLIPDPTTNEFARADVAPAGNKGNGSLTSADVTVLRGYIQNSVRTPVGGPNQPTTGAQTALSVFEKEAGVSRNIAAAAGDVRVVSVNSTAGATNVSVPIELDSGGNENGVTISVQFNTSRLTFVSATPGADVASQSGTTFDVNRTQLAAGRVGVALTLDINQTFTPGPKRVIVLTFNVAANATTSAITFVNNPLNSEINNTTGDTLPATFRAGNVSIGSATAATVSVGGRVTDGKAGSPLKNARVSFTDQSGTTRTATTNSFGYYRIREIPAGGTYVVQITARRFNFAAQTVTINSETDSLDFNIAP